MKITIKQLKQIIKEQVEEELSPMNARKLGDSVPPKSSIPVPGMRKSEKEIEELRARIDYLEKQVQRLNQEATS